MKAAVLSSIIIIILFPNNLNAQTSAKKYYYYTNKAELAITDSNYLEALKYYDSSTNSVSVPLSQDVYNKALCHTLLGNYGKAFLAISFLIERGVDSTLFNKQAFRVLKNQKRYWNQFLLEYPVLVKRFKSIVRDEIISDLRDMNESDQKYFCELPGKLTNVSFIDSLRLNDDFLIERFRNYLNKFGYLHEGIIGVQFSDSKLDCYPIFNILLRHHYQIKKFDLTPILQKAMDSGYLKPDLFARWVGFQNTAGFGYESLVREIGDSLYVGTFPGLKKKIDESRLKITLCTLDERVKKTIFSLCLDSNGFLFYYTVGKLSNPHTDNDEASFRKRYIKVPYKIKRFN